MISTTTCYNNNFREPQNDTVAFDVFKSSLKKKDMVDVLCVCDGRENLSGLRIVVRPWNLFFGHIRTFPTTPRDEILVYHGGRDRSQKSETARNTILPISEFSLVDLIYSV